KVLGLPLQQREEAAFAEVMSGNVPTFWREMVPITVTDAPAKTHTLTYSVSPDYLSIGSDEDYLLMPLTPFTAQRIADGLDCSLPTPKMVNQIYSNAVVKLEPSPIPPGATMVTVPVFIQHNETARKQRDALTKQFPLGALTAGHKKDIVISNKLLASPGKVAIYGWHKSDGLPIQPVYTGHTASWADYSHGVRFVSNRVMLNGAVKSLEEVLSDPALAPLLSNEGVMKQPRYVLKEFPSEKPKSAASTNAPAKIRSGSTNEEVTDLTFDPQVRIKINAPGHLDPKKPLLLIFYTLPNGNTIEHTVGKVVTPAEDWHFNIQHIGAQTRFLRTQLTNENVVVAYLESGLKSWPAWRTKNGDKALPKIIDLVRGKFNGFKTSVVLASHSGGGSFIFGYLNTQEKIPADVERIAFLDSNYGYDTALHHDKLAAWLRASDKHHLMVLAYHDDIALLNGKTFVSAAGGTWGKTHLMLTDFAKDFPLTKTTSGDLEKHSALNGRVQFLLMENPEKKILHTAQVEKNGFIHAILSGTPLEEKGYKYFGDRVYGNFISAE
ncbi:MAG: hypothetical protein JWM68_3685, partial [Verrucomicrobiales bacterium]|nr:hypothetical protein [Verrucomicrobiales bacterium]